MPKKGKKKGQTISLAELHEDSEHVGKDPELLALPTAPKSEAEWAAEGGRPVFGRRRRDLIDGELDDRDVSERDWTRRGPLDAQAGFGRGGDEDGEGVERDFSNMRRGPLDAGDGEDGMGREVDFANMRRGPVDAEGPGGGMGREVDFSGMRRGPVEAEFGRPGGADIDFSKRKGPVDAQFEPNERGDVDFSRRRGPVEAEFEGRAREDVDFSKRKGPVEPEFRGTGGEAMDFSRRRGPVEAEFQSTGGNDVDFSRRRGPVEAELEGKGERDVDFTQRRGPLEMQTESVRPEVDFSTRRGPVEASFRERSGRELDFAQRKGPLDTNVERGHTEVDFAVRKGPVDAKFDRKRTDVDFTVRKGPSGTEPTHHTTYGAEQLASAKEKSPDWTQRRGPMMAENSMSGNVNAEERQTLPDAEARGRNVRYGSTEQMDTAKDVDFGTLRRGSKLAEVQNSHGKGYNRQTNGPRSQAINYNTQPSTSGPGSRSRTEVQRDWTVRRGPLPEKMRSRDDAKAHESTSTNNTEQTSQGIGAAEEATNADDPTRESPLSNVNDLQEDLPKEDGWSVVKKPMRGKRSSSARDSGTDRGGHGRRSSRGSTGRGGAGRRGTGRGGLDRGSARGGWGSRGGREGRGERRGYNGPGHEMNRNQRRGEASEPIFASAAVNGSSKEFSRRAGPATTEL